MHTMLCPALRGRMTSGVTTASSSWGSAIPPSRTWTRAVRWPTRCGRRWRRAAPPAVRGAAGRQQMSLSRSFREFPPPGMCRGRPLRRCAPPNAPTAPAVRCCRSTPSSETLPRFPTPSSLRRHRPASGGGGHPPVKNT